MPTVLHPKDLFLLKFNNVDTRTYAEIQVIMVTLKLTVIVAGVYHGVQSEGEVHVVLCDLRGCGTCRMLLLRYLSEPKMKETSKKITISSVLRKCKLAMHISTMNRPKIARFVAQNNVTPPKRLGYAYQPCSASHQEMCCFAFY